MRKYRTLILFIMLYCIGKILKNSIISLDNGAEGGFWNIITLLLEAWALLLLIGNGRITITKHRNIYSVGFFYSFFAIINSLITLNNISVSLMYYIITLPFFVLVAYLSCSVFQELDLESESEKLGRITSIYILAISVLVSVSLLYIILFNINSSATSNVYYLLLLFPMLAISNNKKVSLAYYILTFVSIVISNKRGALVGFVISIVIFTLVDSYVSQRANKKIRRIFLLLMGAVVFVFIFSKLQNYFEITLIRRMQYMIDNQTLGVRSQIYNTIINELKRSSSFELVFGHGLKSVSKLFGTKGWQAHNDFLQVLYELGVFPFLCLVLMYLRLIGESIRLIKKKSKLAPYFVYITLISLFVSMMSYYIITTEYVIIGMTSLGMLIALTRKETVNEYI